MKRSLLVLLILVLFLPCGGAEIPRTDRTDGLIRELLVKLDSTGIYAAIKEGKIDAQKSKLPGKSDVESSEICLRIAEEYFNFRIDSSMVYLEKAARFAERSAVDSLRYEVSIKKARVLSFAGLYNESREVLEGIPRSKMKGELLVLYYNSFSHLYHELYSNTGSSSGFHDEYVDTYNLYRDSLLSVADTASVLYIRSYEKKAARAGEFAEAIRCNSLRLSKIEDKRSGAYATCLYDRFLISYYYERNLTGEAVDNLLECAIIEVENCNRNIASLLRVEALLININEIESAKKVSDYYYASLLAFGSKKRLIDVIEQTIIINDSNLQLLRKKNKQIVAALVFISLLVIALFLILFVLNSSRLKIQRLKDNLQRSGRISRNYVGVVFKLYSSYIKRLDVFRTKIHSSLKRGNVEQALELTSPSGEVSSVERRELFHNFDVAFVDIFPDYIKTVNDCLKPEERIVPKKTEILNNELRILALNKLGIEDYAEIADLMHCSVKTVYNLRSVFKSRLAIPEDDFIRILSEL